MIRQIVSAILVGCYFLPHMCRAEVRIAVIAPKTGEYKMWGDELVYGAQVAVDEINRNGGVKGEKVKLLSIDDVCSDNLAISTAQMLAVGLENKPSVVIGPYCSNGFEQISQIYSQAKILQIVPIHLSHNQASQRHQGMVKVGGFKEQASRDFFKFYNTHFAGKKVAVLIDSDNKNTTAAFNLVYEEFRKYGKASLVESYAFTTDNLEAEAEKIIASGAEVVAIAGSPKKTAKMIRELKQQKKDIIIVTSKYALGDSLFEYAQDYLDTVYFVALPTMDDNPEFAETLVKLRLQGIDMQGLNIYGYSAVKTWEDMVNSADSFAYDDLSSWIQKEENGDLAEKFLFNNGGGDNSLHYEFYQYKDGEYVVIK